MATTYKIGEAATLLNLKTYVLRFWETEFPEIEPLRTEKGQRLYTEEHLALLERIRFLLHDRGLTIGGARKALAEEKERGLTYTFGVAGAVARTPATSRTPQTDEEYSHDYDLPEDDNPDAGVFSHSPLTSLRDRLAVEMKRPPSARLRRQYNLPGVEITEPLPPAETTDESVLDDSVTAEEAPPQGMLPLFAVVKTAFLAGKAAGKTPLGGANFMQAGFESRPSEPSPTDVLAFGDKEPFFSSDAFPDPTPTSQSGQVGTQDDFIFSLPVSDALLSDIIQELEDICSILRPVSAPAITPASGQEDHMCCDRQDTVNQKVFS